MKKRHTPLQAPAAPLGNETLKPMKTKLTMLKLLITLCAAFATMSALAQSPVVLVWTNAIGNLDMGASTNWDPNAVPNPMTPTADANNFYGDQCLFDGRTTVPLNITAAVLPTKGLLPASIVNKTIPKEKMSVRASTSPPRTCSGDM